MNAIYVIGAGKQDFEIPLKFFRLKNCAMPIDGGINMLKIIREIGKQGTTNAFDWKCSKNRCYKNNNIDIFVENKVFY